MLLYWWGGRIATRRLRACGAELMDLLRLGPPARPGPAPAVELSGPRAAIRLIGAVLAGQHDEWAVMRRYLGQRSSRHTGQHGSPPRPAAFEWHTPRADRTA